MTDTTVNFGYFLDLRRELKKKGKGVYGIKVDLRYRGLRWQFATPFVMTQSEWDSLENRKIRSNTLKEKKLQLDEYRLKAQNIIDSLHPFVFEKFKQLLLGKGEFTRPENRDVFRMFENYIEQLTQGNHFRSSMAYRTTCNSLQAFCRRLLLEDVTPEFLQRYENYLVGKGKSITTVSMYVRCLRCIINEAIEKGLMRREDYPFGRRRYKVPEPRQAKIALQPEQIRKILDYKPMTSEEQRAKDIWVFSYFCGGMNINDICRLTQSSVQGEHLIFYRHKTKDTSGRNSRPINILLQEEVLEIIARHEHSGEHLFPVLDGIPLNREYRAIMQFTKTTNKYLKRIGAKLGIPKLTTQTARHSFATTLMNHGAPLAFISKSMGHSTTKTTEIYLGSFSMNDAAHYGAMLKAL